MDSIIRLSRQARMKAQRLCIIQNFWNGLGVSFVIGDIIALFALFYNANSLQMVLLFSALYASFPAALLAPKFLHGRDCSSIWRWMWVVRSASIPAYFFIPYLPENYRAWAVVLVYFLFCAMRSVGVSASIPVLQVITSESERPAFMGKTIRSFTVAYALVVVASYFILRYGVFDTDQYNYHLLVALGLLFSAVSCLYLFFLPSTGALQRTSISDIFRVGKSALGNWLCRRVMILTMINTVIIILCSYTVPYMKEFMQLSSGNVVLMSIIGLSGAIVATQMLQIIGRRISSWGLILAAHLLIGVGVLFFAISAPFASVNYMFFFAPAIILIYFGRQAGIAIILKVQTDAIPQEDRYAFSTVFQLSGVVSSILAIGYIKICENWLQYFAVFNGNKYTPIFISCAVFCVISCAIVLACHGIFRTTADLKLLAPRSLFTFIQMHVLSAREDRISRMHGYEELMAKDNSLSRSLIMEFLKGNDFHHQNSAIRSLFVQQIDESRPYLMKYSLLKDSPLRDIAITALGLQKPEKEYLPKLLELLKEQSGAVRSTALKTLFRYGYVVDAAEFSQLYTGFSDSMQRLDALIGLSTSDQTELIAPVLDYEKNSAEEWLVVVYQILSDMFLKRAEMMELINETMEDCNEGAQILHEIIEDKQWLEEHTRDKGLVGVKNISAYCSTYIAYLVYLKKSLNND